MSYRKIINLFSTQNLRYSLFIFYNYLLNIIFLLKNYLQLGNLRFFKAFNKQGLYGQTGVHIIVI